MIKIAIFDLDKTLSESRQKISPSMADIFSKLIQQKDVAIISGGSLERLFYQAVSELPLGTNTERLMLLPQSGTSCFRQEGGSWVKVYAFDLTSGEKVQIQAAIEQVRDIEKPDFSKEPLTEDKGGEITYSPVGIHTDPEIKKLYDPENHRREKIVARLRELLPGFEIGIGGSSSIDITRGGMDKSFGVNKILTIKNIPPEEAVFVGDGLFEGGNDMSVELSGVRCIAVKDPKDTERVIEDILSGGI